MWWPSGLRPEFSDLGLKLTGLTLAGGSAVFAVTMSSDQSAPRIHGMEHLAIYARPASHAPGAGPMRPSLIDTAPVGSMRRSGASLAGYEILQATAESVLLRLPEGRVTRVMQGSRVAGLGGVLAIEQDGRLWSVVTQAGVIRQIDHR
jgi:hypothetical protein